MQDPHGLQERENWEEPRKGTASKPWFQSVLCANIQCVWALRLERKSPKSRNCALSALSQPAPPSGGSEPAKMGLEAAASREWPAGLRGPGHGPARERKRRARREPCKRRAPGRRRLRPHQGMRGAPEKPKTAARRRAQPALPAPGRRATPLAPRPRVPFGTDLPAGRGRGRHSHNAPGRAAAVAAASATASGRRWRKAERRTWTPSDLTSRRCSKPRSGKGTPGKGTGSRRPRWPEAGGELGRSRGAGVSRLGDRCGQVRRRPPGQQIFGGKGWSGAEGRGSRWAVRARSCAEAAAEARAPPGPPPSGRAAPTSGLPSQRWVQSVRRESATGFLTDPGPAAPPLRPRFSGRPFAGIVGTPSSPLF